MIAQPALYLRHKLDTIPTSDSAQPASKPSPSALLASGDLGSALVKLAAQATQSHQTPRSQAPTNHLSHPPHPPHPPQPIKAVS